MVKAYYAARILTGRVPKGHESALLRAITAGDARTFLIFGGQGYEQYFDELTSLYQTYSVLVGEFIQHVASHLLTLAETAEARKVYGKGLDIMSWILDPQDRPDGEYLCSAPVSLPCVGVVQLALYAVTCRVLGKNPGALREYFSGITPQPAQNTPLFRLRWVLMFEVPLVTPRELSPLWQSQRPPTGPPSSLNHAMP